MFPVAEKNAPPQKRPAETGLQTLWVGIDIGSTTVKTVAIDPATRRIVFWKYERHNACQAETLCRLLDDLHREFPEAEFRVAACGSGAEPIVERIGGSFIQEVIATSVALREWYPHIRTAVELGGQDAKILQFRQEDGRARPVLADMRMNGSCAGGTGAFIDQMAMLLGTAAEHFNGIAARGHKVHPISGRCGVFAKTDILPLINNGIPREDIALSVFHAVASQTICSLAQGMTITAPVAFMGGPLSYNPVLVDAFAEQLGMASASILIPGHSLVMAAAGAALSAGEAGTARAYRGTDALRRGTADAEPHATNTVPFFADDGEYVDFTIRHANPSFVPSFPVRGTALDVYVGVDAGSTTLKIVLMDADGTVLNTHYANNGGDTIGSVRKALLSLARQYDERGVALHVRGVGTTGYGEQLCARVLGADYHTVETVAHATAALARYPDATFLLDIGGQDMKAISISDGIIRDVYLNEACSSGCGSFLEATARNLGIPVERIAETAFQSRNPASLGSRCTVFMLSSVTTEQKNGKVTEDIIAGLCRSIVENVFSKVLRVSDVSTLGDRIVVQGGTFKNDAVLRAFEQYAGRPVYRPPHCGETGAYGAALLARDAMHAGGDGPRQTGFIGFNALRNLGRPKTRSSVCTGCGNRCSRDIVSFADGLVFCTGHRCEKGDISSGRPSDAAVLPERGPDRAPEPMPVLKERMLLEEPAGIRRILPPKGITVGLPLVFEFWNSMPFWRTVFTALGFDTAVSGTSTRKTAEEGSRFAASDSICFPAKLMHGHIETLLAKKVDRIFAPALKTNRGRVAGSGTVHMCPVVQGLPLMARHLNRPAERGGIPVDEPVFGFETTRMRNRQIVRYFRDTYGIARRDTLAAIKQADAVAARFNGRLQQVFTEQLDTVRRSDDFAVLLLGRPYHADSRVNHGIPGMFAAMGIPVLTADGIPALPAVDDTALRPEAYNPFHTELYGAALYAAREPALEAVQLVSFGCGHDAVTTDEVSRLMAGAGPKRPLVLKIDDGECRSALTIRIRSFVETVRKRRTSR